jgi:type IV pilus assembly protein PilY1
VGERSLSGVSITGDQLVFGSVIPADSSNAGSCTAGGGGGNKYKVNIDTGNGSFSASSVGLFGEILTFDISGATDSSMSISNSTGRRVTKVTTTTVDIGTKGAQSSPSPTLTTFVSGRLSWRQINNYQDLKNAP